MSFPEPALGAQGLFLALTRAGVRKSTTLGEAHAPPRVKGVVSGEA